MTFFPLLLLESPHGFIPRINICHVWTGAPFSSSFNWRSPQMMELTWNWEKLWNGKICVIFFSLGLPTNFWDIYFTRECIFLCLVFPSSTSRLNKQQTTISWSKKWNAVTHGGTKSRVFQTQATWTTKTHSCGNYHSIFIISYAWNSTRESPRCIHKAI